MGLLFQSQNGAVAVPQNLDEEYPVLFHLLSGDKAHSHSEITHTSSAPENHFVRQRG